MNKEDAKDLTLSILVVVVALLAVDNIWLHCKCSAQSSALANLTLKVENHLNPPPQPGLKEMAKETYNKAKTAMKNGYQAVREKIVGNEIDDSKRKE